LPSGQFTKRAKCLRNADGKKDRNRCAICMAKRFLRVAQSNLRWCKYLNACVLLDLLIVFAVLFAQPAFMVLSVGISGAQSARIGRFRFRRHFCASVLASWCPAFSTLVARRTPPNHFYLTSHLGNTEIEENKRL
jgi:hypothetical protein